jgi:hypothetical protein
MINVISLCLKIYLWFTGDRWLSPQVIQVMEQVVCPKMKMMIGCVKLLQLGLMQFSIMKHHLQRRQEKYQMRQVINGFKDILEIQRIVMTCSE